MDAKRRIVAPQEFRSAVSGPFDGLMCFPSIEADCLEGGGQALFERYEALIAELPFGDPTRSAIEFGGGPSRSRGLSQRRFPVTRENSCVARELGYGAGDSRLLR